MTVRVLRFGSYSFEDGVIQFSDNFLDLVPRTMRLPGLSGGYSEDGSAAAVQEIGNVSYQHMVRAAHRQEMRAKLDALRALIGYGQQRLTIQPAPGDAERFCWANLNNIQISQNVNDQPAFSQAVQFNWQVTDPRWYSNTIGLAYWGEPTWGDGSLWGGSNGGSVLSGLTNSLSITPGGNAPTRPVISVMTYAGQTVSNPTIQRLVNGQVVDQVSYTIVLTANQTLVIDCRAQRVTVQSLGAYGAAFATLRPERWFELQPGANSVKVLFGDAGDAARVRIGYYDAWY